MPKCKAGSADRYFQKSDSRGNKKKKQERKQKLSQNKEKAIKNVNQQIPSGKPE